MLLDQSGILQKQPEFKPIKWLNFDQFQDRMKEIRDFNSQHFEELDTAHFEQVYYFIDSAIKDVQREQEIVNGKHMDFK